MYSLWIFRKREWVKVQNSQVRIKERKRKKEKNNKKFSVPE